MSVTIKDIARRLNTSPSTVSRILNNKEGFHASPETRERVAQTAREMGYRPNRVARMLTTGRTDFFGLWCPRLDAPYYVSVAGCFQQLLNAHGYELITTSMFRRSIAQNAESLLPQIDVNGMLTYAGSDFLAQLLGDAESAFFPIVDIHFQPESCGIDKRIDFIHIDLHSPSVEAMEHLIAGGRNRIIHLKGTHSYSGKLDQRHLAYKTVMKEAGFPCDYLDCPSGYRSDARQAIKEYVGRCGCPDAVFCSNDDLAIGAYRGLRDLGLTVPDDAAIIGCDGLEDTEYLDAPITTIVNPVLEMINIAWQFLQNRMQDRSMPQQSASLRPYLCVRESSGSCPI
jgi:LacI family transcriptional regulator